MAAQLAPRGGFSPQPDPGSERSADSPAPASEDDSSGHVSPPDPLWTEERFQVDRKKLETKLLAASEGEDFFQKVMDETSTQITWPSKLKIGAKSKKDPNIKVSGRREDVREAKERILSVLRMKTNRVTLKMDVSHTEHSLVIGKGGNNIKRVMEETGCHIHFPDSNRISDEKSNQVSIAGQPAGAEAARAKIRGLLPFALMFECGSLLEPLDCNSQIIQHISQSCNVSIACKLPSHLYVKIAVVRSNHSNAAAVKRGTALLLDHLAGSLAGSVPVSTQLDVAPQHHLALFGRNGANLKHITQRTGAHIHFPNPSTHTHRSALYIQGSIDAVCDARLQLMGCLPLVLMFNIKQEVEVEEKCITTLMEQLDVFISIRLKPKPKQTSKTVIVKSVERNAENMYEARRLLLAVESSCGASPRPPVPLSSPVCPVTSEAPLSPGSCSGPDHGHRPSSPLLNPVGLDILASAGLGLSTLGFLGSSGISVHNGSSSPNPVLTGHSSSPNGPNGAVSTLQNSSHTHSNTPVYTHPRTSLPSSSLWTSTLNTEANAAGFSSVLMLQSVSQGSLSSLLLSGVHSFSQSHTHGHTPSPPPGLTAIHKPVIPEQLKTHIPGSVYRGISSISESMLGPSHCDSVQEVNGHSQSESLSSKSSSDEGSDTFVEVGMPRSPSHSANGKELKQMLASCKASPGKRQTMEMLQGKASHLHSECLLSDSEADSIADKRAPGSERAAERNRLAPHLQAYDYEQQKLLATKAMLKKPVVTEVRTPTNTWSGLGFSKSMPAESIKQLRRASHAAYKPAGRATYEGPPPSCVGSGGALGNGSGGDSWRDRNGSAVGNGLTNEFPASVSPPERSKSRTAIDQYLSSSNYMDCISSMGGSNSCSLGSSLKGTDLPELFSSLGLGKYIDVFQQQEIDLQTFMTLTDPDLKELGITTFGARRKMLLAISELNKSCWKPLDPANIHSSFLEGGASGRLSRQFHSDMASISGRW